MEPRAPFPAKNGCPLFPDIMVSFGRSSRERSQKTWGRASMEQQETARAGIRVRRRDTLRAFGALGLTAMFGSAARAQTSAPLGAPSSVLTIPPRQWGPDAPPAK